MKERVKELRKILNLTQTEFSNSINLKQNSYSKIENGRVALTERNIKTICEKFNVNEDWLRNGNEPIFIDKDNNNYINELIKKYDINSNEINILKKLINIDENTRNKIINFMFDIIKENIDKIDENKILNISKNIPKNVGITDEDIINFNNNSNKNIKKDTY